MTEDHVPTVEEIRRKSEEVLETAVRIRGEQELGFMPESFLPTEEGIPHRAPWPQGSRDDWGRLHAGYAWIPGLFERSAGPDPAGFDGLVDVMWEAERKLYDQERDILPIDNFLTSLGGHLASSQWDGDAAENFRHHFLHRLDEVTKHQSLVAFTLKHALIANQDIYREVRRNVLGTAEKTVVALDAIDRGWCDSGKVAVAFTVVGAVASIGAAVATFGGAAPGVIAGWSIAAGVSSGIGGVAGTMAEPDAEVDASEEQLGMNLAAETVDGVLNNMSDALAEIQRHAAAEEQKIIDVLRHDFGLMTSHTPIALPDGERRPISEFFLAPPPDILTLDKSRPELRNEFEPF